VKLISSKAVVGPAPAIVAGLLGLLIMAVPAEAIIDASLQMQLGNPSNAGTDTNNHDHYLVQRTVEALDFSDNLGEPVWASWDLTAADVGSATRSSSYFTDNTLPANFYHVTDNDYNGVGGINFNRGHMCPSEDRTDTEADNDLVFYMSNIIPQAANNNQGVWASFESYCRSLASGGNELLIICGPSGFGTNRIPSGRAAIGNYTWKIVVVVPGGSGTALSRITSATRVISLKIPNSNGISGSWQSYVTAASQIEVDTGFTFFTALSGDIASALRNKVDGQSGPAPVVTGFSPTSGQVNDSIVVAGSNFTSASTVQFNGVSATFQVNSDAQVTASVPANATSGHISVTTPNGTGVSAGNFTVTGPLFTDLRVGLSHTGNFAQGDAADTYTITVTNIGNGDSSGTVTVTDTLPPSLTAVAISGTGWTVDLGTLTCTRSDVVTAGAGYPPITVTVSVAANAPIIVTNSVTVSGGGDSNLSNNSTSDPTIVSPSGGGGSTNVITLAGWDVHALAGGVNNFGPSPLAPSSTGANVSVVGFTRGSGVGTSGTGAQRAWGGNTWTDSSSAGAISANHYVTFGVTASAGYRVSFSSVSRFAYRHSATGPVNGLLQYQIGPGSFNDVALLSYPSASSSGDALAPIDLSGIVALQSVGPGTSVTFRIVNWGATTSAGTWYVFDTTNSTDLDFIVQGTVSPVLTPIETWRQQWFGTISNAGYAADTYVFTSDGMANLLKYAMGLNPLLPTNNPATVDISTGFLRFTVPKNPSATDVSLMLVGTDDLGSAWETNGIVVDQNTATLFQAHYGVPIGSSAKRFMRLGVTRP
jgi:uncharacterized repeat protein (TIGR01451 family)